MFTGIVEEIGLIKSIRDDSIFVSCNKILEDIHIGDSISVDGVCLTVTQFDANGFWADVSYETRKVTKLFNLKSEDKVNLERAMTLASRFGGHIISGHVDCVGKINSINKNNGFYELTINLQTKEFSKYFVKKGSIAMLSPIAVPSRTFEHSTTSFFPSKLFIFPISSTIPVNMILF